MKIDVALENFVPLNQQQREAKPVIIAEIKRLREEKTRRVHWQGLAYKGMNLVDAVLQKSIVCGAGTTEDEFARDCEKVVAEIKWLREKRNEVLRFMDEIRNTARNRNPDGATILDFMAVWNEQCQDQIERLKGENERLREIVAKAQSWMVASGLNKHPLTIEMAEALVSAVKDREECEAAEAAKESEVSDGANQN